MLSPLFAYLGPALDNINIFLIFLTSLCLFYIYRTKVKKFIYIYLKELFFLILFIFFILISYVANFTTVNLKFLVKIPYFLFFIFNIILIHFLFSFKTVLNEKLLIKFLYFFFFLIFILAFDLIFQKIFSVNILGFSLNLRPSSFFRSELIAGGFLSKIFPIFIFCYEKKIINKNKFLFMSFFIFLGIGVSGERSALIIFLIINFFYWGIFNFSILKKNLWLITIFTIIFFTIITLNFNRLLDVKKIFFHEDYLKLSHDPIIYLRDVKEVHLTVNINKSVNIKDKLGYIIDIYGNKKNIDFSKLENTKIKDLKLFIRQDEDFFLNFSQIKNLNENFIFKEINKLDSLTEYTELMLISENKVLYNYTDSGWGSHQLAAIKMFQENIFIGNGPNSFRYKCSEEKFYKINSYNVGKSCTTHPHNLHIEILQGVGIFGYISFILFLISLYYILIKNNDLTVNQKKIILIIILCFFPIILPTGSFFSTSMMNRIFFCFFTIQIINSYAKFKKK